MADEVSNTYLLSICHVKLKNQLIILPQVRKLCLLLSEVNPKHVTAVVTMTIHQNLIRPLSQHGCKQSCNCCFKSSDICYHQSYPILHNANYLNL